MPRFAVLTPIKVGNKVHKAGEIELDPALGERLRARGLVRPIELAGEEKGKGGDGSSPKSTAGTKVKGK